MGEIYDCCICLELFDEPRGLPCLHYFCTKCLQKYIDNTFLGLDGFQCPYCRKLTLPDDMSIPINKWAVGFPAANRLDQMAKLLDGKLKKSQKTNPSTPDYCDVCSQRDDVDVDAVAFCKDCMINVCPGCYHKHPQDHNIMVCHKLITSPFLWRSAELCGQTTTPDLFCCKCLAFTDADCVHINHATCKEEGDVKPLEPLVKNQRRENEIYIDNLKALQKDYEHFLSELSESCQEMKPYEAKVLQSKEAGEIYSEHLKTIDDKMCEIQNLLNRIHKELERRMFQQKTANDFQYLLEYLRGFTSNEKTDYLFEETDTKKLISHISLSVFKAKLIATIEPLLHL